MLAQGQWLRSIVRRSSPYMLRAILGRGTPSVCRASPHSTTAEGQGPRRRRQHKSSNPSNYRKSLKEVTLSTSGAAAGQQAISRVLGKETTVVSSQHGASAQPAAADTPAGPAPNRTDGSVVEATNAPAQLAATSEQQGVADAVAAADATAESPPTPVPTPPPSAAAAAAAEAAAVPPLSELVPLPGRGEPQYPDAPFKLRPYQVEAIHKVIQEWKAGVNVQMVMLPTGCGKTVVFAALARYLAQHYIPPTGVLDTAAAAQQSGSTDQPTAALAHSPAVTPAAAAGDADSTRHAGPRGHGVVAAAAGDDAIDAGLQQQADVEGSPEGTSSSAYDEAIRAMWAEDSTDSDAEDFVEDGLGFQHFRRQLQEALADAPADTAKPLPTQDLHPSLEDRSSSETITDTSSSSRSSRSRGGGGASRKPRGSRRSPSTAAAADEPSSSSSAAVSFGDDMTQGSDMEGCASDADEHEGSGFDDDDGDVVPRNGTGSIPFKLLRQRLRGQLGLGDTEEQEALVMTASAAATSSSSSSGSATATLDRPDVSSSDSVSAFSTVDGSSSSSSSSKGPGKAKGRPKGSSKASQSVEGEVVCAPGAMRVLVLAHRYELLRQAEEKFKLMWGDGSDELTVSWVKGKRKEYGGQVVVASVATAVNCIDALKACKFSLVSNRLQTPSLTWACQTAHDKQECQKTGPTSMQVIVDEAHHSVASTYTTILEGLGFIEEVPEDELNDTEQQQQQQQQQQPTQHSNGGSNSSSSSPELGPGSLRSVAKDFLGQQLHEPGEGEGEEEEGVLSFDSDSDSYSNSSSSSCSRIELASSTDGGPKMVMRVVPNPHQLLLGFTATPYRMKKSESSALYSFFPTTYVRSIPEMIRAGHLSPVGNQKVLTQTDLKGAVVGPTGDFNIKRLSALVNSRSRNRLVLASYLEHCTEPTPDGSDAYSEQQRAQHARIALERAMTVKAALDNRARKAAQKQGTTDTTDSTAAEEEQGGSEGGEGEDEEVATCLYPLPAADVAQQLGAGLGMSGRRAVRKTIGFAVDIRHAEALNAVFNAAGVRASAIHSLMPHAVVRAELSRFRNGDLDVLFNVEVLTEGFDEPAIDAILMARPTRSPGLYTQMLGRGLRIMPGKKDCKVLDFTDKHHQAGKVVDARVLLPDLCFERKGPEELAKKGPSRIDTEAEGGETEVLEKGLDPSDLAWQTMGSHLMASMFSGGYVWLVNVSDMGPTQRKKLGIAAAAEQELQGRSGRQQQQQQQQQGDAADDDKDDESTLMDAQEDRYVVLHQQDAKGADPSSWKAAFMFTGHTWKGLRKEDAYGTALDYMEQWQKMEQVNAVRRMYANRSGKKQVYNKSLNAFKADASWRHHPASDAQIKKLKQLGLAQIDVVNKGLTKGEASDMISGVFVAMASPQQLQQLKERLGPEAVADLPVPLLQAYATTLLEASSNE